jgi:hypothetical protein
MMRLTRYVTLSSVLAIGVAACGDPLNVENVDSPDRTTVLAKPADVASLVGTQFGQIITGTIGATARVHIGLLTAAFENGSTLANNGLGPRSAMPRPILDNSRGNAYANENFNDYRIMSQVARVGATGIAKAKDPAFELTLGAAQTARTRAFSWFVHGLAVGNLAMVYDSAGIPKPEDGPLDIAPLVGYKDLADAALKSLDSALVYASSATAAPAFPLPDAYMRGSTAVSQARFVQLIRSMRARVRAEVARNPTERAAVDWAKVIDDATNGITADFNSNFDPNTAFDYTWLATGTHFRDTNWHQMTPYIIGMADTSRAYEAWLAVKRPDRVPFTIKTPDLRFPAGETRAAQNAVGQGAPTGRRYFRNRAPGLDQAATGWQNSEYDHYRWRAFADASRIGPFPIFTVAENDLLAAEGYLRTNQIAKAAALIDKTRTTAGLPSVAGVTSLTQQVPGGNACVPRIPVGPSFTTTQCGTIFEAMKWEKRMEMAYTVYGAWYFDSRGWGDLPEGTPLSWPVPYQELDARLLPLYTLGGVGGLQAAGVSTYGFGTGDR